MRSTALLWRACPPMVGLTVVSLLAMVLASASRVAAQQGDVFASNSQPFIVTSVTSFGNGNCDVKLYNPVTHYTHSVTVPCAMADNFSAGESVVEGSVDGVPVLAPYPVPAGGQPPAQNPPPPVQPWWDEPPYADPPSFGPLQSYPLPPEADSPAPLPWWDWWEQPAYAEGPKRYRLTSGQYDAYQMHWPNYDPGDPRTPIGPVWVTMDKNGNGTVTRFSNPANPRSVEKYTLRYKGKRGTTQHDQDILEYDMTLPSGEHFDMAVAPIVGPYGVEYDVYFKKPKMAKYTDPDPDTSKEHWVPVRASQ